MDLYHFTPLKNVEVIKQQGLQPRLTGDSMSMIGFGPPTVFLCDTPTSAITDAELKILLQRHPETPLASKRWLRSQSSEPLARFTVRLPSNDRKLKQYGLWLRSNHCRINGLPDPDDIMIRRAMKTWWLYYGEIKPSRIVECITESAHWIDSSTAPQRRA